MDDQDSPQFKEKLNNEKLQFLAVVSHELRKPLTEEKNILSFILEGDAGPITSSMKDYLTEAYVANEYMIELVDRMNKVATIRGGRVDLKLASINLTQTIQVVVNDFKVPTFQKGQSLTFIPLADDLYVLADHDSLWEILNNLISNASKYTPRGGKITITCRKDGDQIITSVQDTGIGIAKENQDKVFDIFSKAKINPNSNEKGTGVGLHLSKKLVDMQGGKLYLEESIPGKGSIFSFSLKECKQ